MAGCDVAQALFLHFFVSHFVHCLRRDNASAIGITSAILRREFYLSLSRNELLETTGYRWIPRDKNGARIDCSLRVLIEGDVYIRVRGFTRFPRSLRVYLIPVAVRNKTA